MVHKVYSRLSCRIAEEKQLLAEEKWIIDALTKIRKQRNCLQIERLELESLKTQLLIRNQSSLSPPPSAQSGPSSSESAVKIMTSSKAGSSLSELEEALPQDLVNDTLCNEQQLNLTVTNPILSLSCNNMVVEEEESDGSDEDDSPETIFMDMNMFMNSNNPAD